MDIMYTILPSVISLAIGLGVGFLIGKIGLSQIESDISNIKGLISGQSKIAVVQATPNAVVTPVPTTHS